MTYNMLMKKSRASQKDLWMNFSKSLMHLPFLKKVFDSWCASADFVTDPESSSVFVSFEDDAMQIFVKTLELGTLTLDAKPSDTIAQIRAKMRLKIDDLGKGHDVEYLEYAMGAMPLEFAGKTLEDDKTLFIYSIQKDNTIHMTGTLGGEGKTKKEDKKKELEDKLRFKKERMGEKCSKAGQQVSFQGLSENTVNELIHEAEVFLQASDGDASQAIETMLKKLPSATLDKMKNALKQDTGGDSAFKLKQTCGLFFGDKSEKNLGSR